MGDHNHHPAHRVEEHHDHKSHNHHHLPHHHHEHEDKIEHERKTHHDKTEERTPIDDVSKEETDKLTANIALAESGPAILEPSLDSTTTSNNKVIARDQRD